MVLRTREELGRIGEDGGNGFGGNSVVGEVYEAGSLEAVEDGLGSLLFLGGSAAQEGREIDELQSVNLCMFQAEEAVLQE